MMRTRGIAIGLLFGLFAVAFVAAGRSHRDHVVLAAGAPVDLTVTGVDQYGEAVLGICARLTAAGYTKRVCDGADDSRDGVITFIAVPAATYTLTQTTTPSGYVAPTAGPLTLSETSPNAVTLTSARTDVQIVLTDQDDAPVIGACFNLAQEDFARTRCDRAAASDGLDGTTLFERVPVSSPLLSQTTVPYGSGAIGDQPLSLTPGILNVVSLSTTTLALVDLTVAGIDQDGLPVNNICATLADAGFEERVCDAADGTRDGLVHFEDIPAATFTLTQTRTSAGYLGSDAQEVTLSESGSNMATFVNGRTDVEITLLDEDGLPLPRACFDLTGFDFDQRRCDSAAASEGLNGVTLFQRVPVIEAVLSQTRAPSGSSPVADQTISITPGMTNRITLTAIRPEPSAELSVSVIDPFANPYDPATHVFHVGDAVTVWFEFTNTGNVPLIGAYLETTFGQLGDCTGQGEFGMMVAPGQSVLCAYGWQITAEEGQAGQASYEARLVSDQVITDYASSGVFLVEE